MSESRTGLRPRNAALAAPVTKAAWAAQSAAGNFFYSVNRNLVTFTK